MFQVIQGQSRYELQQQLLLNPNGLVSNETNRFGDVDALGNVSSIKSVSHPNFGNNLINNVLTEQPTLSVSKWGNQNAVFFDHTQQQSLDLNASIYNPEWNVPKFIAAKFELVADAAYSGGITTIWSRGENVTNYRAILLGIGGRVSSPSTHNKIIAQVCAYNTSTLSWKYKQITTTNLFNTGVHTVIYQNMGTNNINDDIIYVDGVEESYSVISNQSFIGATSYPSLKPYILRYGRNERSDNFWRGYLGKVIDSTGVADITNVVNSLNSAI